MSFGLAAMLPLILFAINGNASQKLGEFVTYSNGVTGELHHGKGARTNTLIVKDFTYDGEAPDAQFYIGLSADDFVHAVALTPDGEEPGRLRAYAQEDVYITFPPEMQATYTNFTWLSVWSQAAMKHNNFGDIVWRAPASMLDGENRDVSSKEAPESVVMSGEFTSFSHGVKGKVMFKENSRTIFISDFSFDGTEEDDARFYIGNKAADGSVRQAWMLKPEVWDSPILEPMSKANFVVRIPTIWNKRLSDFSWLGVWSKKDAASNEDVDPDYADFQWDMQNSMAIMHYMKRPNGGFLHVDRIGSFGGNPNEPGVNGEAYIASDNRTMLIRDFKYGADAVDAYIHVGSLSDTKVKKWQILVPEGWRSKTPLSANAASELILRLDEGQSWLQFNSVVVWSDKAGVIARIDWAPAPRATQFPYVVRVGRIGELEGFLEGQVWFGADNQTVLVRNLQVDGAPVNNRTVWFLGHKDQELKLNYQMVPEGEGATIVDENLVFYMPMHWKLTSPNVDWFGLVDNNGNQIGGITWAVRPSGMADPFPWWTQTIAAGRFTQRSNNVTGLVFFGVDNRTIKIMNFEYDGAATGGAFFQVKEDRYSVGGSLIGDARGLTPEGYGLGQPLPACDGDEEFVLFIPYNWGDKTLKDFYKLQVASAGGKVLADIEWASPITPLKSNSLGHFISHVVTTPITGEAKFQAYTDKTIIIKGFSYDGSVPDAQFFIGRSAAEYMDAKVLVTRGQTDSVLRAYTDAQFSLDIPADWHQTVGDFSWLAVWSEQSPPGMQNLADVSWIRSPGHAPGTESDLLGQTLGWFTTYSHSVAGKVKFNPYVNRTIKFKQFQYDGKAGSAVFVIGKERGDVFGELAPVGGGPSELPASLPDGRGSYHMEIPLEWGLTIFNFSWIAVWDKTAVKNHEIMAEIEYEVFPPPAPGPGTAARDLILEATRLGAFRPYSHGVMGRIKFDKSNLTNIVIKKFSYDGLGTSARFMIGQSASSAQDGTARELNVVDMLANQPLPRFNEEKIRLAIPLEWNLTLANFSWLSVWDSGATPGTENYADVTWQYLPKESVSLHDEESASFGHELQLVGNTRTYLGMLNGRGHAVSGQVYASPDFKSYIIMDFLYDGVGSAKWWVVSNEDDYPDPRSIPFKMAADNPMEREYLNYGDVTACIEPCTMVVEFPEQWGAKVKDFYWLGLWTEDTNEAEQVFGDISYVVGMHMAEVDERHLAATESIGLISSDDGSMRGEVVFSVRDPLVFIVKSYYFNGLSKTRFWTGTVETIALEGAEPVFWTSCSGGSEKEIPAGDGTGDLWITLDRKSNKSFADYRWLAAFNDDGVLVADLRWRISDGDRKLFVREYKMDVRLGSQFMGSFVSNSHGVSGDIHMEGDEKDRVVIKHFSYDPMNPDGSLSQAYFAVGAAGVGTANALTLYPAGDEGMNQPLRQYNREKVRLQLPQDGSALGYSWLAVWSPAEQKTFGVVDWNAIPGPVPTEPTPTEPIPTQPEPTQPTPTQPIQPIPTKPEVELRDLRSEQRTQEQSIGAYESEMAAWLDKNKVTLGATAAVFVLAIMAMISLNCPPLGNRDGAYAKLASGDDAMLKKHKSVESRSPSQGRHGLLSPGIRRRSRRNSPRT